MEFYFSRVLQLRCNVFFVFDIILHEISIKEIYIFDPKVTLLLQTTLQRKSQRFSISKDKRFHSNEEVIIENISYFENLQVSVEKRVEE